MSFITVTAIRKANALNPETGKKVPQFEVSLSNGRKSVLLHDKNRDYEEQYQELLAWGRSGEINTRLDVRPSQYGDNVYSILSKKEYSDEVIFGQEK